MGKISGSNCKREFSSEHLVSHDVVEITIGELSTAIALELWFTSQIIFAVRKIEVNISNRLRMFWAIVEA